MLHTLKSLVAWIIAVDFVIMSHMAFHSSCMHHQLHDLQRTSQYPSIHIPAYYILVMIQTLWYSPWFVKTCNSFVGSIYLHKQFLPIPTTCNNAICNVKSVWFMSFSKVLTQDDLRASLHISCVTSRGRCKLCHMRKLLTNYWIADLIIYPLSE